MTRAPGTNPVAELIEQVANKGAPKRVTDPGVFADLSARDYHADPAPEPSLSSSLARTILDETPRHAYAAHPRLGGTAPDLKSRKLDLGSIAHELLTGQGRGIHVIGATDKGGAPVEDYRTKAAQEERDEAITEGLTPVLPCDLRCAEQMVSAVRRRLDRIPGAEGAFADGQGEAVAVWQDRLGLWGRCMIDWWGPTETDLWDLKTTSAGLSDRAISSRIADGLDVQAAWYRRGIERLRPDLAGRVRFRFVFVETVPPFECRVVQLDGEARHLGERRVETAAIMFRECLRTGEWPGFPDAIATVSSPPWASTRWEERELSDPLLRRFGSELLLGRSPFAPDREVA